MSYRAAVRKRGKLGTDATLSHLHPFALGKLLSEIGVDEGTEAAHNEEVPSHKMKVQIVAVSACPKCGCREFSLEAGWAADEERAMLRCGSCDHVGPISEFSKKVPPSLSKTVRIS